MIQASHDNPLFSSHTIVRTIQHEEDLIRNREEQGLQVPSTALAAQTRPRSKIICAHCKNTGHLADFCIQPGGKMEGRSLDDARTAQRTASRSSHNGRFQQGNNSSSPASPAHIATSASPSPTDVVETIELNGKTYYSAPPSSTPFPAPADFAGTAMATPLPSNSGSPFEHHSFEAFATINGPSHVSLDWSSHTRSCDDMETTVEPVAYSASHTPVDALDKSPFILDTGATCHISPMKLDFKSLCPIVPHPITGIGGAHVHATGVGSIKLCSTSNHKVMLEDVLYIPTSTVRLISVLCLNRSGGYVSSFDSNSCWVTNKSGATVLRGVVLESRRLFGLSLHSPCVGHARPPNATSSAYYASRTPDLETWHWRLGHCGNDTIIDMAHKGAVQGMHIDLSSAPPRCNHCILGKQTCSSVLKSWEGSRVTCPLEHIFVDLCGPMPCRSRSGWLYSMNLIDDFSSYAWSLPLRSKDKAASILQLWHRAVENQSSHRLKIIVSDNGKLISKSMHDWASMHGIDHQCTAPYTSAQNRRAERLHRTLLSKARAMRLSCNAPAFFWDEFCATSAYLSNLTASSTLNGKTPYELWTGRVPSLSHLQEIGCQAFALIQTNNPKIYHRSRPCILIGYAPHTKAYQLWDTTNGSIFNSFHVTFLECLDQQPVDLLPGTTISIEPGAPPSWDASPASTTPPSHSLSPTPPTNTLLPPSTGENRDNITPTFPPTLPSFSSPGENHHMLTPNSPNLGPASDTSSSLPSVRRSSRSHAPSSHIATNDGLLPSRRLADAISDAPASTQHQRLSRTSKSSPLSDQLLTVAFLSEFIPYRESHSLLPLDTSNISPHSLDSALAAIADGDLEPVYDDDDDPKWANTMASPEREFWIAGAREELRSLEDLKVFVLVLRSAMPKGRKALRGKLMCKRKRDDKGHVVHYKVRYVAKGFTQIPGVDYDKTTTPTARLELFQAIAHIAASLDWELHQFNIKTAFLNGILPESKQTFMEQPAGFEVPEKEDWVLHLMKSIYGMKQASQVWNITFNGAIVSWGFH
jgi:transposase InsO family protein